MPAVPDRLTLPGAALHELRFDLGEEGLGEPQRL